MKKCTLIFFLGFTFFLSGCAIFVKNVDGSDEIYCDSMTNQKKYNLVFRNLENISQEEFNIRLGLLVDSLRKKECFNSVSIAKQDFSTEGDSVVLDVTFPKINANFIEWSSGFLSVFTLGIIPMYKKTVKVFSLPSKTESLEVVEYTVGSLFLVFAKGRGTQIIHNSIEKETAMLLNFINMKHSIP